MPPEHRPLQINANVNIIFIVISPAFSYMYILVLTCRFHPLVKDCMASWCFNSFVVHAKNRQQLLSFHYLN